MSKTKLVNPTNDRLELLDLHQGLLCRMRTNNAPVRCGAVARYIHHFDVSGPKSSRHHASPLCQQHAETVAQAMSLELPLPAVYVQAVPTFLDAASGVMTGAQAVAAMTGSHKSTSERIAEELVMYIKQQEALTRQIEVGIERCRTMLRILRESNERKYQ